MGRKKPSGKNTDALLRGLFFLYCLVMVWLLFGQRFSADIEGGYSQGVPVSINLIPFATVRLYWQLLTTSSNTYLVQHAFINLAGNVLMFVPLGVCIPALWRKERNFFLFFLTVALVIAAVEGVQLLTRLGSCDIDDFLLNMVGALLGYVVWCLFLRKKK